MRRWTTSRKPKWDLVLDTNLKGMYVVTRAIAPAIGDAGGGAIVNMSTIESEVVVSSRATRRCTTTRPREA